MKTFEQIQGEIIASANQHIHFLEEQLKKDGLSSTEVSVTEKWIETAQSHIENSEEAATIFIGAQVNTLIKNIQTEFMRGGSSFESIMYR